MDFVVIIWDYTEISWQAQFPLISDKNYRHYVKTDTFLRASRAYFAEYLREPKTFRINLAQKNKMKISSSNLYPNS
jgi:hypothetical protein